MRDGRGPAVRYLVDRHEGAAIADQASIVPGRSPADAAAAVMAAEGLRGWLVATEDARLGTGLVKAGATPRRHAFIMRCDLREERPTLAPPHHLHPMALPTLHDDPGWLAILPSWRDAFPPDHPDHFAGDDDAAVAFLHRLMDGTEVGPLDSSSVLLADDVGRPLAGVMVNLRLQDPSWGGPWIADIWRDPALHGTGVGAYLVNRVQHRLADAGHVALTLKVSHGNPARRSYERAGFRVLTESHTVALPG